LALASKAALIVSSDNLAEQIHRQIKSMIVLGELHGGKLYSVGQLAEMFDVSRTPVREALLQLAHEGLLRPERNRGFRVLEPSAKELDEIFEVRLMLEVPAMEKVALLQPPPKDSFLEARRIYCGLQAAADNGDLIDFLGFDREFHLLLVRLCGNRELTRILADLRDRMFLPGLQALARSGQLHPSAEEHVRLLDSLEAGDAEAAKDITARHVRRTREEWATGGTASPHVSPAAPDRAVAPRS
jgi:DNA-binding GntR family transcriptional regulator